MAQHIDESEIPTIFNEIIRKRVADYIDKELIELIRKRVDVIITDIMADLQNETQIFKNMKRYETNLVVKAIYNGKDIEQKTTQAGGE